MTQIKISIPALREWATSTGDWPRTPEGRVDEEAVVLALVEAVEAAQAWETNIDASKAAYQRLMDALARFDFGDA